MKKTKVDNIITKPIIVPLAPKSGYGGGPHGRPFCGGRSYNDGVISRIKATPAEKARAGNFRALLRELSADFDRAYRKVSEKNPQEGCTISDLEIDELLGPILKEHGYDVRDLALRRQHPSFVRKVRTALPTVFDLDLTEPYKEVREFKATLEWIERTELCSQKSAFYVPVKQASDSSAAVFAPVKAWEESVSGNDRNRLVAPLHRAYKNLTDVLGIDFDFHQCRIVHFLPWDQAELNAFDKLWRSSPQEEVNANKSPMMIVEGQTVIAAAPYDRGDIVTSATLAVESAPLSERPVFANCSVLPDMNAVIAHAKGISAFNAQNLS